MTIKADRWIIEQCEKNQMIFPFERNLIREVYLENAERLPEKVKILSKGVSSYGYDCSLSDKQFKVFSPIQGSEIDPKNFDTNVLLDVPLRLTDKGEKYWLLPPHSYGLGLTVEYFKLPNNVLTICVGKSTYARSGLFLNLTPGEAGWQGNLVVELFNAANLPIRIYAEEGLFQMLFFESDEQCNTTYEDRGGKYQAQDSLVYSKV